MLRSKVNNVLENTLIQIRKLNKPCLIAGDFNIDLLKYNIHQITSNYIENLLLHNILPTVVMPTRISEISATVIDHIYFSPGSKFDSSMLQSGNIWCDLTKAVLQSWHVFKRVAETAEVLYYKQQFDTCANSVKQLWSNLNKLLNYKKTKVTLS